MSSSPAMVDAVPEVSSLDLSSHAAVDAVGMLISWMVLTYATTALILSSLSPWAPRGGIKAPVVFKGSVIARPSATRRKSSSSL